MVSIVGARPQFVNAAAVSHALRNAGLREVLVHTGRYYDWAMPDALSSGGKLFSFFKDQPSPRTWGRDGHGLEGAGPRGTKR